ncbi:MAG: hypothetical protein LBB45_03010 [Methanobrevibacter sp.]|nr:hypothetical protein [Candidatus Methanovirga basalitermitum]
MKFKIGTDLPAGTYKLTAKEGANSYYEVNDDLTSNHIVTNSVSFVNEYVTVEDGQYLQLQNCAYEPSSVSATKLLMIDGKVHRYCRNTTNETVEQSIESFRGF